jgi:GNAT superfamily N-acetyltransferase
MTHREVTACLGLTFGPVDGEMYATLSRWRRVPTERCTAKVVLLRDRRTRHVLGWAIVELKVHESAVQVFVAESCRRRGFGRMLLRKAISLTPDGRATVTPHDTPSDALFRKFANRIHPRKFFGYGHDY